MTFAGPGRRIAAYAIDAAVVACVAGGVQALLVQATGWGLAEDRWLRSLAFLAFVSLPAWTYFATFESSRWRATPGKRVLGMRVVDDDGGCISFRRAFLRAALKWAPIDLAFAAWNLTAPLYDPSVPMLLRATLTGSYGLAGANVMAIWLGQYRQALHDLICDTLVLVRDPGAPIPPCPVKGLEQEVWTHDDGAL